MTRLTVFCFLIIFLPSCTHDAGSVRVHHYGISDGGGSNGVHTVHVGDTLWSVSQRYNVPLRDIMDLNSMTPPYVLAKGQRLLMPAPNSYEVRKGDSLYAISRLFDISVTDLSRLNNLNSPYIIHTGQTLQVPSSVVRVKYGDGSDKGKKTYVSDARLAQRDSVKPTSTGKKIYTKSKVPKSKLQSPEPRSSSAFLRPVQGEVISKYGPKKDSLQNDGVNIKAPKGSSVRSAENGVVAYSSNDLKGYGNLILIKHADNYITAYAHMDKIIAKKGQKIKRGEVVGTVGSTGSVKTPQLHFELRRGTKTLDPSKYINN